MLFRSVIENRKLNTELASVEAHLSAAERGANNWEKQLNKGKIEADKLSDAIDENNQYLDEAKASADDCATSIDQYGNKTKGAADSVSDLGAALAAAGAAKLIKEIADAFMECADASIEFESAITGVYKTVDGTAEELSAISDGIKEMAVHIPATTTEIAAVAEAAGQLGIKTADILSFTEVMVNLGVATNLTAEEAASMLAKFANVTGLDPSNYSNLGSVVVALGNNFATTERDIVTMATRLASAGKLAGLTEAEILALSASMSSVGIAAEAGGTAMTQTFSAIEKAVVKGGEKLDQFADVAGMSAEDFATKWRNSPVEAIQAFIAGLGGLEARGENATLILDEMGLSGVRQSNMLKSLALSADNLSAAVDLSNGAWMSNTALLTEASLRYATTESRLQMMENAANNLKIAVGDALAPALGKLADIGTSAFQWAADFIEDNPVVVSAVLGVVTALGALLAAFAAFTVIQKLIPLIQAFNVALAANPAIVVAAAVTGLVVAVGSFIATLDDADDQVKTFSESLKSSREAYDELSAGMEAQQSSVNALKDSLIDLLEIEGQSANEKNMILQKVEELNEAIPGLNLVFDEQKNALIDIATESEITTEALDKLIQKALEQDEYNNQLARMSELLTENAETAALLTDAQNALTEAQEAGSWNTRTLQNNVNELSAALDTNKAEYDELYAASQKYAQQQADSAAKTTEMESRVNSLIAEMDQLEIAYGEAYISAYDSITKQLGLFNDLDGKSKKTIGDLISTLAGQCDYMNTYAANITAAMELGVDKGLVQKLSDGSEQSAQILAAIVEGGETEIAALNEEFAKVEEGKEKFSGVVAEMETDFDSKMADITARLNAAIKEMDVSGDAHVVGSDNVQGLINGAESKRPQLIAQYRSLANSALSAYKSIMAQMSPSKKMFEAGAFDIEGLIVGAKSKETELKETYGSMAQTALDAVRKAQPSTLAEPSVTLQQERQTDAIIRAISTNKEKPGDTIVNITSPEALDERTAAREFKKAQRDLSLGIA